MHRWTIAGKLSLEESFGLYIRGDETCFLDRQLEVVLFQELLDVVVCLYCYPDSIFHIPVHHIETEVGDPKVHVEEWDFLQNAFSAFCR